jgi:hypothetical protein
VILPEMLYGTTELSPIVLGCFQRLTAYLRHTLQIQRDKGATRADRDPSATAQLIARRMEKCSMILCFGSWKKYQFVPVIDNIFSYAVLIRTVQNCFFHQDGDLGQSTAIIVNGGLACHRAMHKLHLLALPFRLAKRRSPTPTDKMARIQALEDILASDEKPPPSLREVAERLQCTDRFFYRCHQTACYEITNRCRAYVRQRKEARMEQYR